MSATTCETGFASRSSDPLLLPRVLDNNSLSNIEFESWLSGISAAAALSLAEERQGFEYPIACFIDRDVTDGPAERFYESPALQYPYRSWMDIQSRLALFRRRPHEASGRLLNMWRQLGREGIGGKRVARVMQVIPESCYGQGVLLPAAENRLRLEFLRSARAKRDTSTLWIVCA